MAGANTGSAGVKRRRKAVTAVSTGGVVRGAIKTGATASETGRKTAAGVVARPRTAV
jgi:hypothetical protein